MTIISRRHISAPLTLPVIITALLFSTSACSNQSTTDTNADLAEYEDAETS
ncbi:MAG TPA: glucose dehydrogenase, partial [Psychrobacter sp.]|nr:glucose dehydrogenase [Psychrobacter sp.]